MSNARSPLQGRLQQLRDASLPFVARTFRGPRLRRYTAASLLLGVLSVLLGIWLSFGTGDFERDIRNALDLEDSHWEHDRIAFQITAYDGYHHERLVWEMERFQATGTLEEYAEIASAREQAYGTLYTALSVEAPAPFADLQQQVRTFLEANPPAPRTDPAVWDPQWYYAEDARDYQFDWYVAAERSRLQAIMAGGLVPEVVLYRSPLSFSDGIRLTGAVAGGIVVLLMLIVAPLSSGATLAQEVHENTLQPVLGTRLRPVDIVTGLTASGVSLGALLAAPSFAVMLLAGVFAGHQAQLIPLLLLLPAASMFTVLLTQLVGFGLGRRWSSGIVATVLTAALCMMMLFSIGIGMNLDDEATGLIAMMPPVGLVHGLRELFVPGTRLGPAALVQAVEVSGLAIVGFAALAFVMGRALTRRIEGRTQASLTRLEGFLAAGVSLILALAVIPDFEPRDAIPAYYVSLGLAAMAWMVILGGRVPVGDGPAKLRTIPLRTIMLELGGYVALHTTVLVAIFGVDQVPWAPIAAFHLVWGLGVMGLVAVRMVALPTNVVGSLFIMLSLGAVCFELVSSGVFAAATERSAIHYPGAPPPFVLFDASVVLGVLQLALTVAIPVLLVRALRKGSAGLV